MKIRRVSVIARSTVSAATGIIQGARESALITMWNSPDRRTASPSTPAWRAISRRAATIAR